MLSGYQVEVVGFNTENGPLCYDCAVKDYGVLAIEKLSMGLTTSIGRTVHPVIRYEAGEAAAENGYYCGCADDLDHDPPKAGEEPEGYEGPLDEGYYAYPNVGGKVEAQWHSHIYHEACATYDCVDCGENLAD
jgi:hypothetical protein